jgi:hypothetical protein
MTEMMIAERLFRTHEGTPVVARIYSPERMGQSSEWSCKIEVEGLEPRFEQASIGVDSFQALYGGLRQLCAHLDKVATTLTFLDGREGDVGTPLIVPWSFTPSLKAEVYQLILGKIKEELEAGR